MLRFLLFAFALLSASHGAIIEDANGLEDVLSQGSAAAVLWVSKDREGQEDLHKLVDMVEEVLDGKLQVRLESAATPLILPQSR